MIKHALSKSSLRMLATTLIFSVVLVSYADQPANSLKSIPIESGLPDWKPITFNDMTLYEVITENDTSILKATSNNSASGLVFEQEINIKEFPYLNWSWKINKPLPVLDEETKQGDDYAARVYVIIKDGWFFWQTKALNYVWSSRTPPLPNWPNAYAPDNTLMVPLRTATSPNQSWFQEKRNIYEDLKEWLGKEVEIISAIAIMTDSDDSKQLASATYRNIFFSTR